MQGVVDQVAGQRAQGEAVAVERDHIGARHARVNAQLKGMGRALANGFTHQLIEAQRLACAAARGLFLPRQIEQLRDQMAGTVNAAVQGVQRGGALRIIGGALGDLRLQLERGHRRAQLVRRVGDERALGVEGVAKPVKQAVERGHQ